MLAYLKNPLGLKVVQELPPADTFHKYLEEAKSWLFVYGSRIVVALVVLILGFWIIRLFMRGLRRFMLVRDVDPSLKPFISSIVSIALKIMLLLTVASMMGIETTSFMAALGAAGLAIGLALQGSLSNFAGGMLILFFKPFRVGDFIGAQGHEGTVNEINILYTILNTADNKRVVIPNGVLSNNDIVNFTANDTRRIELYIQLAQTTDVLKARKLLQQIAASEPLIIQEPAPIVGVDKITDNAIIMLCFVWVKRTDFLAVKHDLYDRIVKAFREEGIFLPFTAFEELIVPGTRKA